MIALTFYFDGPMSAADARPEIHGLLAVGLYRDPEEIVFLVRAHYHSHVSLKLDP